MANQHKHPARGLRGVDDDLWSEFGDAAQALDSDRSRLIREFIEWFVSRPGAELPARPEPPSAR